MLKTIRGRIVVILAVLAVSGGYLYTRGLKLGLDLQGGMHLVLEVDDPEGTMTEEARADAIQRAERIIRTRIDEFGVEEPLIQQVGSERIIVELAGIDDEDRAKDIIRETAFLEWKLVLPSSEVQSVLPRLDRSIVAALGADSLRALGQDVEAPAGDIEDLLLGGDTAAGDTAGGEPEAEVQEEARDTAAEEAEEETSLRPFTGLLSQSQGEGTFLVPEEQVPTANINIMTVENPVEYELAGITQTQVEPKQGVTFGSALRAMLRQDPDVILVGEIRDRETAETAAHAAMTGHLVLATVHANDAVASISRMVDMGLQWSTAASTLRGTLAQRLMRKVCPACAEPVRGILTPEEQRLTERHGMEPVVRAVGCPECGFSGYKGRLPVQEVMMVGPRMQQAIELRKGHATLFTLAQQGGMRTMHTVALEWVQQGKTTLVEVERVLGQIVDEDDAEEEKGSPRILLVDDDEEARLMMRSLLEKEGYELAEAEDGPEALDMLKEDPEFSLIVLDLAMPQMDGREVLKRVRGSVDTAALPVLIRTGTGTDEMEAELLEAGADDYITKTTSPNRFLARVRAVLRRAAL